MATSGVGLVPDQSCAVEAAPGLNDAPSGNGGDLIDNSDYGPGRWRSCLVAPEVLVFENTAHCGWSEDRTTVTEIIGLPTDVGDVDFDGHLTFAPVAGSVSLTDPQWDRSVHYDREGRQVSIDTNEAHVTGRAAFELAQSVDPELGIVVGAPTAIAGTIAWVCGAPPAAG